MWKVVAASLVQVEAAGEETAALREGWTAEVSMLQAELVGLREAAAGREQEGRRTEKDLVGAEAGPEASCRVVA